MQNGRRGRERRGGREGYLLQTFLSINIVFKENILCKINFKKSLKQKLFLKSAKNLEDLVLKGDIFVDE